MSIVNRFKLSKRLQEAKETAELEQIKRIRNSRFTDFCNKIRWAFYIQVGISIGSFFYQPFKTTEIVKHYERITVNVKGQFLTFRGIIKSLPQNEYQITSRRLRDNNLVEGDTVQVLRNFFYKIEGVKHKSSEWPYFLESKWVFCFVWFFFGAVAMLTEKAYRSHDLQTRNLLSMLLLVSIVLYFII